MKKMIIAVFAVIAAVTAAGAQDNQAGFGGKNPFQPQSMHSIFSDGHSILPAAALKPGPSAAQSPRFGDLARYYLAQEKIKKVVAEYLADNGYAEAAAALAGAEVSVAAEHGSVYIVTPGGISRIQNSRLAGRVEAIVRPGGQQKILHPGVWIVVGCMYDKECWDAVGDGVSAVSEWANS